ncbi:CBS domain-containing protein [Halobacterium wangiae]|uniref:CBS domain-containing protein n=1 Tax=Halobacterium wangiae TaxID=2902623 RepID=UPI001E654B46|nr:CBS domain-containing protein [Halobacterium wangiae]
MPVGELGPEDVVTVEKDAKISDVVDQLESENVGAIVVTDEEKPVGIVTDRDVALALNRMDDLATGDVTDIMTEDPVTLREDDPELAVARTIEDENVRRIPVVDEDGKLTGIVTLDDLVATVGEELGKVSNTIESQSPDYKP